MKTVKNTYLIFLLLDFFLNCLLASGQKNPIIIDSKKIIKEGIGLFDKEKYNEAIENFKQVPQSDSSYFWAQYEMSLAYLRKNDNEKAIEISKNVLEAGSLEANQYNIFGTALDNLKRADEAIAVYNKGISKFPYNESLQFNKGIVYEGKGEFKQAFEVYKNILKFSPFHTSTHLRLARICVHENLLTQAIMSYAMFIVLEPVSNRSLIVLSELNNLCTGNLTDIGTEKTNSINQEFEDIDLLVTNQVALNNKYKVPGKYSYPVIKQLHLVMEKLSEIKNPEKEYYSQFYLPAMLKIKQTNSFETLALLILASSDNDEIKKQVEKKKNDITVLREKCLQIWIDTHPDYEVDLFGKKQILKKWYYQNYSINAFGLENEKKQNIGDWLFLTFDGALNVLGHYNSIGQKTGEWLYFEPSGDTLRIINFKEDKADGPYTIFKNGFKSEKGIYKNGMLNGEVIGYFPDGSVSVKYNYLNDKLNGVGLQYYNIGTIKNEYNFVNNDLDGLYKEYYPNKISSIICTYKAGKYIGNFKSFFEDGHVKNDINYNNGILEGIYLTYYRNGKTESEGKAIKGSVSGELNEYYSDGKLKNKSVFDENGKINGEEISFDHNGRKFRQSTFQKGEMKRIQFFDIKGNVISDVKIEKNGTFLSYFNFQRDKISEGKILYGECEGEWHYFTTSGQLSSTEMYKNKTLEGQSVDYHKNGKVSAKLNYTNDKIDGLFNRFYPNGTLKTEGNYIEGEKWDLWYEYYINGCLKKESYYLKNNIIGFESNYGVSGKLDSKFKYNNYGILEGIYLCDTNGIVIDSAIFKSGTAHFLLKGISGKNRFEGNYVNGYHHGFQQWFYPDGKINITGNYYSGYPDGEWKWFHPNGKISTNGKYFQGEKTGVWENYDFFGNLTSKSEYLYGKINGTNTWYYKDGKIESQIEFFEDERNNVSYYYANNGDLRDIRFYEYGKLIGYSYHDKNKKLVDTIYATKGDAEIKAYYYNGNVSTQYFIKNNEYNGSYKIFYPSGVLQEERNYEYGYEVSPTIKYYPNGKISRIENYYYGDLNGEVLEYNSSGTLRLKENYKNNVKHGVCEYFDNLGKRTNAYIYYNDEIFSVLQ